MTFFYTSRTGLFSSQKDHLTKTKSGEFRKMPDEKLVDITFEKGSDSSLLT